MKTLSQKSIFIGKSKQKRGCFIRFFTVFLKACENVIYVVFTGVETNLNRVGGGD